MWFQRAKVQWMVDGDRNTKFYHTKVVQHHKNKVVNVLKDEECNWIEDSGKIRDMFNTNFINLYTKYLATYDWSNTHHTFLIMESQHRRSLESDITYSEVK